MQFFYSVLFLVLLSGCASNRENKSLSEKFFSNPSSVVVTEISGIENPVYHVDEVGSSNSGSMIADLIFSVAASAITNTSAASGREAVTCIDASSIVEDDFFKPYINSLSQKGFKAQKGELVKITELKAFEKKEDKFAPYNFSFLKEKYGSKYALVLEPHFFGAKHRGTFSNPTAFTNISVYMVDLDENILEGFFKTTVEIKTKDDWDKGEYESFIKTTVEALELALRQSHSFLFNQKEQSNCQ